MNGYCKLNNKFIILLFSLISINSFAAELNCSKAVTNIEKTICSDSSLYELDKIFNKSYNSYKNKYSKDAQKYIKEEQLVWLNNISNLCSNNSKLNECIRFIYEERIDTFKSYKDNDYLIYQASHNKNPELIYPQFDSQDVFLNKINKDIKKMISQDDGQHEGTTGYLRLISIEPISRNFIKIEDRIEGVNAYPWQASNYYYYDIEQKKELTISDVFSTNQQNKIISLIQKDMYFTTKEYPEAKQCFSEINKESIKNIISNLQEISINKNGISFDLKLPRICQPYGTVFIDNKNLNSIFTTHMKKLLQ